MQLNNKENGKIIKLVSSNDTGIAYNVFENGLFLTGERKTIPDVRNKKFIPNNPMCEDDLKNFTSLELVQLKEIGFEFSTDLKNWIVGNGSTNKETVIRVFIPKDLREKCDEQRDNIESIYYPLYELIMYCYSLPAFTYKSKLQYLECFEGNAKNILKSFENEGVIIGYKYPQIEGEINLV